MYALNRRSGTARLKDVRVHRVKIINLIIELKLNIEFGTKPVNSLHKINNSQQSKQIICYLVIHITKFKNIWVQKYIS